jgi:hypothetical protein
MEGSLNAIGCESIDLRGPSGDHVDLTGTWTGAGASPWNVRQLGNCLFMVGFEQYGSPYSETVFHSMCEAQLRPDFTAPGRCIQLGRNVGLLTFEPVRFDVVFDEDGEAAWQLVPGECLTSPNSPICGEFPTMTRTGPDSSPLPEPTASEPG